MAKVETNVLKNAWLLASRIGSILFRNNVGVAKHKDGSYVRYGLCNGSSDLIGWTSVDITADMVGRKVAVFTALEIKKLDGDEEKEQRKFIKAVQDAGGYAGFARSDADVRDILPGP